MSLRKQLPGTGVAIITPFKSTMEVDFDALGKLIDFIVGNGIEYIVTLGTTGETPTLDAEEKFDIINFTYEKINNRVPVVVGIGGNNTKEVMENLQSYPLEKATAVLSSASSRFVPKRAMPWARASASILPASRPINIGSGITLSPPASNTPPWARMAQIERIRCWFMPMRPVTPCITMPRVRVLMRGLRKDAAFS